MPALPQSEFVSDHRFLDEAGDTTFFGAHKQPIVGNQGVSLSFAIGMVKFAGELPPIRAAIRNLQAEVAADRYLNVIPSIAKKVTSRGFYFHATDDPPEVRERFFRFIEAIDCSCEVVVARKLPKLFVSQHNTSDSAFYADVLSHLLKNKLRMNRRLVLNIAERGKSTKNANLEQALVIAQQRFAKQGTPTHTASNIVFNVQNNYTEPLLNVVDYMCWSVQRVFERGETRYYDFLGERIKLVVDLYDDASYVNSQNYYRRAHRLTSANKISPPSL
jgi:hypothetical protein